MIAMNKLEVVSVESIKFVTSLANRNLMMKIILFNPQFSFHINDLFFNS